MIQEKHIFSVGFVFFTCIVIGVAGVGEAHLDILAIVAEKMLDDEATEKLINGDVETIYQILAGK